MPSFDLSIITVNFNNAVLLERTLLAVSDFKKNHSLRIEFIVIDGGSLDGSVELCLKYKDCLDLFVSEKDSGIYEAMNKGILLSSGEFLWFINAGDIPLVCQDFSVSIGKNFDFLAFPVLLGGEPCAEIYFGKRTRPHQGLIVHRRMFAKVGLYNVDFKFISDRLHFDRLIKSTDRIYYGFSPICRFDMSGVSRSTKTKFRSIFEFLRHSFRIEFKSLLRAIYTFAHLLR